MNEIFHTEKSDAEMRSFTETMKITINDKDGRSTDGMNGKANRKDGRSTDGMSEKANRKDGRSTDDMKGVC